jgi:hypothetical protein
MSDLLNAYLQQKMKELDNCGYCPATNGIKGYVERCALLKAAGHDTTQLQAAVDQANLAIAHLKIVSAQATGKFMQEGAYVLTDKAKLERLDAEQLS